MDAAKYGNSPTRIYRKFAKWYRRKRCVYTTWMRYFIRRDRKIDGDEKESNILTEGRTKYIISLRRNIEFLSD